MYRLSSVFLTMLLCLCGSKGFTQGFLRAQGQNIVNEKGENVLLRGMGLGGWMLQEGYMLKIDKEGQQYRIRERIEALIGPEETRDFYEAWLANHVRKADVDSMKRWGFNSVRLPMHYNLYTLPSDKEPIPGENTWLETGFQLTDSLLSWCKANKMYLILDLHAAPGGQGNDVNISDRDPSKPYLWNSEANQRKTIALWKKLAQRYKDEPFIGGYDILNEPNYGFENPLDDRNGIREKVNAPLRKLMQEITLAIREVDQNHLVIIEGNGWGNNYNGIFPLWDNNMVLSFHKYWNYNDQASIAHILKAREEQNVPVWLGETGENSNVWFRDAIALLEKNNIGWAWWPLKKIGVNNPMEIHSNPNYDALVKFLNQGGPVPDAPNTYKGLMNLAHSSRLERTSIHRDVIDAMIRQPFSNDTKPFKNHSVHHGAIIYAVDYDMGRNNYAYFDRDTADYHVSSKQRSAGNRGRIYRNDGVDIVRDSSTNDRYYVNSIEKGEWLQYTLNVGRSGNYTVKLSTAATHSKGRLSILLNEKVVAESVIVPASGGNHKFAAFGIKNILLKRGEQKIKICADEGDFSLSYIEVMKCN